MDPLEVAQETLDAMLGYLGFVVTITADPENHTLHVASRDGGLLIGPNGERLEEITHLLNRLLLSRDSEARHVQVDIDGYLATRDYRMIEEADEIAARVFATGKTIKLEPMNSYQRRLIHHHFKDHPPSALGAPKTTPGSNVFPFPREIGRQEGQIAHSEPGLSRYHLIFDGSVVWPPSGIFGVLPRSAVFPLTDPESKPCPKTPRISLPSQAAASIRKPRPQENDPSL
jgi:hypothetical protein